MGKSTSMTGNPAGQPAHQIVDNPRLAFPTDRTTATASRRTRRAARYQRDVFAGAADQVITVRPTTDRAGAVNVTATLRSAGWTRRTLVDLDDLG
jgi:alpha-L-fucosidase 2